MSLMERIMTEKRNVEKLDRAFRIDINKIKISIANTYIHEKAKFDIAWCLANQLHSYVCEARFINGARTDVYDITTDEAYEIETNMKGARIRKDNKYPVQRVIIIDPKKEITKQM